MSDLSEKCDDNLIIEIHNARNGTCLFYYYQPCEKPNIFADYYSLTINIFKTQFFRKRKTDLFFIAIFFRYLLK